MRHASSSRALRRSRELMGRTPRQPQPVSVLLPKVVHERPFGRGISSTFSASSKSAGCTCMPA